MYIKLNNGIISKYPYSIHQLKKDNKEVSFPNEMTDEQLEDWGIYPVTPTDCPPYDYNQNILEGKPQLIKGVWTQVWNIVDKPQSEIDEILDINRLKAYRAESDPLFFKWQRGEATEQEWLDKVAEIKQRDLQENK